MSTPNETDRVADDPSAGWVVVEESDEPSDGTHNVLVMTAPGGSGPIGPYPSGVETDDEEVEYDKLRRRVLWTFPSGLYVVGSRAGDRRNGMTATWITQLSFDPKLVGVSVEKTALTHELVSEGGSFTINTIDREDRAIVRKFTKPVEVSGNTMNEFSFHDGPTTGAPVLDQAAAFVECEVRTPVDVGDHTLFIGEVTNAGFQKPEEITVLRMEDTRMNYGG
jgi:flavin reductase (DIM6/NTAB) family NADH-FMN oxidoreductase RutF